MTRFVHISTRYLGSGAERYVADLIQAFPEDEHTLIVGRDHHRERIIELCGEIDIVVVPTLIRTPHPIDDPRAFMALVRLLRRFRPDVVHTIESKAGILGRAAARATHVPVVIHSVVMRNFGHGFNPVLSLGYRAAERVAARWTDQYLVNGGELRDLFRRDVAPDRAFALIRSSVDASAFRAAAAEGQDRARSDLGLPAAVPIALFAGALDRRKGAHALPDLLEGLRNGSQRPDS